MAADELKNVRVSSQYKEEKVLERLRKIKNVESKIKDNSSFRDFSKFWLGKDTAEFWSAEREVLEKLPARLKNLAAEVEKETDPTKRDYKEQKLEILKRLLNNLEATDKSIMPMLGLPYNADYSFFFNRKEEPSFWQLLNNIS